MPALTVETVRTGGVTFVELLVEADRPCRVRVESRLEGPVWPPRSGGRSEDGWDEAGVTRTVEAGRTPLGFATPAPPQDTVAEVTDVEPTGTPPEGVAAWLDRVEGRIEAAERLAAADDLPSATAAVTAVGGLAGVEDLATDLARDRRALARLSFVPDELCERADSVEIPVSTLARLAHSRRS